MSLQLNREALHEKLTSILDNVYFQPPSNFQMVYPCITYKRVSLDEMFADNDPYIRRVKYLVTFITTDPDSEVNDQILSLSMTTLDKSFNLNGLIHNVYTIYL